MEVIKTIPALELQDAEVRRKNKELMRSLSETGYSRDKSDRFKLTTLVHRFLSKYVEKREYDHNYMRKIKFATDETEMTNGVVVKDLEYEQHYTKVTCYVNPFSFLGINIKIQYNVMCESFRQLRIDKRLVPIPVKESRERVYHICNKQVSKEEYEAYKANK